MSVNNLIFTGNCGQDMEVRHTTKGTPIGSVSVALTQGWGDNKKTVWVKCSIWGERAEGLAPYLKKGTPVTIQGELEVDTYQSNDGTEKTSIGCKVGSVAFGQAKSHDATPRLSGKSSKPAKQESFDDDIPF
jgi:single-strand DNA-binding protein